MKKVLVFAFVASLAIVSQAVSFSWSISNIKSGGSNMPKGSFIAYVFADSVYDYDTAVAAAAAGTLDVSKALDSSTGTANGKVLSDSIETDKISAGNQDLYVIVFDSTTPNTGNYIATSKERNEVTTVGTAAFGFGSQSGKTWTPIPEPTTVALLALGLAALGLKRKVA